ncbi:hypothetical protein [Pseudonocardia sp.]|uniref:hypothetical protein n=1 Tax=Pseudonocardia sp. TaxID=60912 RepID=UPI0026038FE4|nr:hypothetical protein [Pseudonocardia sp.]
MNDKDLAELREHFGSTDLSEEIETATWETEVEPDPMVVTSLRLPKSLLDWVRDQAEAERVKPTALIRRWIEDRRPTQPRSSQVTLADLAARVDRLESVALHVVGAASSPTADTTGVVPDDNMKDLLVALQRSVEAARAGTSSDEVQAPRQRRDA